METKKSSIPLSPPSANFRQIGLDLSLLALAACLIYLYLSGLQIAREVFLDTIMASGEKVVDAVSTPDNQITPLIISESCGIRCSCPLQIDLKTYEQYTEEFWLCVLRASFVNFVVKFWPGG